MSQEGCRGAAVRKGHCSSHWLSWCVLAVYALACGPTDVEKAHFADQCKSAAPTEDQGWFGTKFSSVQFKTLPSDPRFIPSGPTFGAVSRIRGRGLDGAFRSAQITCSGFGEPRVTATIGEIVIEPISDADREWLYRQILEKASAAAGAQRYGEAVLLLKGKGRYKADTSRWLETDASFKTLLASALKNEAKQKKAVAVEEARERVKQAKRDREQVKEGAIERREYAHALRSHFLDSGSDIEVSVSGSNADRLVLRCVLFNAVWVHQFQKGNLIDEIRAKGFRVVKFDNIYQNEWTIPLHQ